MLLESPERSEGDIRSTSTSSDLGEPLLDNHINLVLSLLSSYLFRILEGGFLVMTNPITGETEELEAVRFKSGKIVRHVDRYVYVEDAEE